MLTQLLQAMNSGQSMDTVMQDIVESNPQMGQISEMVKGKSGNELWSVYNKLAQSTGRGQEAVRFRQQLGY